MIYRAIQLIQIFLADGRANGRTNEGNPRGPRGPKTFSDVDDMDIVGDVEDRDLVCRADEPASSHQRGLYTSGWGEKLQKLCLLGHTANQNIRSTLLKKSGFNGMRLGPISVPVTSLSLPNIFNGTITQIKSSRSK